MHYPTKLRQCCTHLPDNVVLDETSHFWYISKMEFEWDNDKAEKNASKHKITFFDAVTVFADPYLLLAEDTKHSQSERRERATGESESGRILVVVFTRRCGNIQIISARPATKKERISYDERAR